MTLYSVNGRIYHSHLKYKIELMWYTLLPELPVTFMMLVVVINLQNWSTYYFKIGEMAMQVDSFRKEDKLTKRYK